MKTRGFTLLELMIVILVLAILSVVVVDSMPKNNFNVQARAEQLANDLRYAQFLAMSNYSQAGYCVEFTPSSYTLMVPNPALPDLGLCGMAAPYPGAVTLPTDLTFTPPAGNRIVFNHRGLPCTDINATSVFGANASMILGNGEISNNVIVSATSGLVSIQ